MRLYSYSLPRAWLLAPIVALFACAPPPSLRTYDPFAASDGEVTAALAQLEDLAELQEHYARQRRYATGAAAVAVGITIEALLLARDPCEPTDVFGVTVEDCGTEAALVGAAGGLIGGGFAQLVIPLDTELDRRGVLASEASTMDQRRVKLEYMYRVFEHTEEGFDMGVLHQIGSGILLGLGVAFMTLPVAIDDDDLDVYLVPGAVSAGVGVVWGVLAGTLRKPTVFDLDVRPDPVDEGLRVGLGVRF